MANRLLQLLARNAQARPRLVPGLREALALDPDQDDPNEAREGNEPDDDDIQGDIATLYVYGAISDWEIDLTAWVRAVDAFKGSTLHVRINSPGGDVFTARAMKAALDRNPAQVICHVDGLAASAASFLMLAGDQVLIADGAMVMIHEPWGWALGTADEMRASASILDKVNGVMVADYARKMGKGKASVSALLKAETWYTSDEAVTAKLCDAVEGGPEDDEGSAQAAAASFDLSAYAKVPETLKAAKPVPRKPQVDDLAAAAADRDRYAKRLALYELG